MRIFFYSCSENQPCSFDLFLQEPKWLPFAFMDERRTPIYSILWKDFEDNGDEDF